MSDIRSVGPLYCETPLVSDSWIYDGISLFPLEPLNALTSFAPALCGVIGLVVLYRRNQFLTEITIVGALAVIVGVGSVLWHGFRTPFTLLIDWIPGMLAFMTIMFLWPLYLYNRWFAYAMVPTLFGLVLIVSPIIDNIIPSNGPPVSIFLSVAAVSTFFAYLTYRRYGALVWYAILGIACALIAAFSRIVDLMYCSSFPYGTHMFWHIFLGFSVLIAILMFSRMRKMKYDL